MTRLLVTAIFFFSGAAGLVYEIVWTRQLSLIFGVTTYAVATVLAVFMGGLALGSHLFGRWIDARRTPLLAYALLEAGVGCYAGARVGCLDAAVSHDPTSVASDRAALARRPAREPVATRAGSAQRLIVIPIAG